MATKTTDNVAKSKWEEKITIRLPKANPGEDNFLIASVNGRIFKIQKGIEVEVPRPIAKVIKNSLDAEAEAEAFIEGKIN